MHPFMHPFTEGWVGWDTAYMYIFFTSNLFLNRWEMCMWIIDWTIKMIVSISLINCFTL